MNSDKFRSYLGLAMRAGKLVTGDEGVLKSVRAGEAKLVVLALDAAANMRKKYADKCAHYKVPLIEHLDREQLGGCIGKPERVVLALTDAGFARLIVNSLDKNTEVDPID